MQFANRVSNAGQLPLVETLFGKQLWNQVDVILDCRFGGPADFVHFQPVGQAVTRDHRDRQSVFSGRVVVFQPLRVGVAEFPPPRSHFWLAGKQHDVVGKEFLQNPRLIEPDASHESSTAADQNGRHHLAGGSPAGFSINDLPADALLDAGFEFRRSSHVA